MLTDDTKAPLRDFRAFLMEVDSERDIVVSGF
jgi:hypothetical protein